MVFFSTRWPQETPQRHSAIAQGVSVFLGIRIRYQCNPEETLLEAWDTTLERLQNARPWITQNAVELHLHGLKHFFGVSIAKN
jgi:hypothetical protein